MFTSSKQRQFVADAMPMFGFSAIIAEDETKRPIQTAWYAGAWKGRPAVATVIGRKVATGHVGAMGNRHKIVTCLQVTVEPTLRRSLGFGVSKPFDARSPTTVTEAFPPDHAAFGFHPLVKDAFVTLIQPAPGRRVGPQLRITDRQTLDDYLPALIHPNAPVIILREIAIKSDIAQQARHALDTMSWLASILESTEIHHDQP